MIDDNEPVIRRSTHYRLVANESDPMLHLQIAPEMLKELVRRSNENGCSIEVEIAQRLARSLEEVDIPESDIAAATAKRLEDEARRAGRKRKLKW